MHLLPLIRLVLVLLLAFVSPFTDVREAERMRADRSSWRRLRFYRRTVVILWVLAAIACAVTGLRGTFVMPYTADASWAIGGRTGFWLIAAVTAAYFGVAFMPGVVCAFKARRRPAYTRALAKLSFLLPASTRERRWFVVVSVSAGVCEEVLFRGFLLPTLRWEMGMGLTLAWLVSSVIFGLNHLYQGKAGVIQTTVAGLGLGLLAILSGGLALPIVLHAVLDLQALVIYRPHMLREAAMAGVTPGARLNSNP